MPVSLLNTDTSFPSFTEGQTVDRKFDIITDYLYMLLEELRYTFGNLGTENFNDQGLDELSIKIGKPILIQLEDVETGLKNEISITAEGLEAKISSAEGKVSSLTQTVEGFETRVSSAEGKVSSLTQTVEGFETRVSSAEGKVSTLTQTVNSFDVKITNAVNNADYAKTLAASLSADVDDNSASISQIVSAVGSNGRVTAASIVSAVNSSGSTVKISADKIKFEGEAEFLTADDVGNDGSAVIAGNRISINMNGRLDYGYNTLTSENGLSFNYVKSYGADDRMGRIYTRVSGEDSDITSRYALHIETDRFENDMGEDVYGSLKLNAAGRMSLEAQYGIYISTQTYGNYGGITLDASDAMCIRVYSEYSDMVSSGKYSGYCFCTDGIYYNGAMIVST